MANERVSQSAIGVLVSDTPKIRVSQSAIQLLTIPGPLIASCNNPPNGLVGQAYSTAFTQVGGTLPVTWSLVSGAFPGGLLLNAATGVLSGTPNAAGTFNFTVRVTDATGLFAQVACVITIGTAPVLSCNNPPNGTVGAFYSQQFGLSGGTPPYSLALTGGSFPPGLTMPTGFVFISGSPYLISGPTVLFGYGALIQGVYPVLAFQPSAEGVLSGVPLVPGTFSFTLQLTDALGNTSTVTCSITIVGAGGSPCQTGGPG